MVDDHQYNDCIQRRRKACRAEAHTQFKLSTVFTDNRRFTRQAVLRELDQARKMMQIYMHLSRQNPVKIEKMWRMQAMHTTVREVRWTGSPPWLSPLSWRLCRLLIFQPREVLDSAMLLQVGRRSQIVAAHTPPSPCPVKAKQCTKIFGICNSLASSTTPFSMISESNWYFSCENVHFISHVIPCSEICYAVCNLCMHLHALILCRHSNVCVCLAGRTMASLCDRLGYRMCHDAWKSWMRLHVMPLYSTGVSARLAGQSIATLCK